MTVWSVVGAGSVTGVGPATVAGSVVTGTGVVSVGEGAGVSLTTGAEEVGASTTSGVVGVVVAVSGVVFVVVVVVVVVVSVGGFCIGVPEVVGPGLVFEEVWLAD